MVNAEELIKEQKCREDRKYITFNKIYQMVENKIRAASACNNYYAWYQVPEFLVGSPLYSYQECKEYIRKKLTKSNFEIELYPPNILLIKWFPKK
jgi:hypothetical protein